MTRRLVKDRTAAEDLIEIWSYSFETWDEAQADRYLAQLESGILALRDAPERGRARPEFRNHAYFSKRVREHVVFYTFDEDEVRIRRVLHKARDYERHL